MNYKRSLALRDSLLVTVRKMKPSELRAFRVMLAALDDVCAALLEQKEKADAE